MSSEMSCDNLAGGIENSDFAGDASITNVRVADTSVTDTSVTKTDSGKCHAVTTHKKRASRRVVMLSRVDQERLARGEISTPEEAVHASDARGVHPKQYSSQELAARAKKAAREDQFSPHEREILAQVPPHFGKI